MCTGLVHRPLPGENLPRGARWVDALGLDSAHDYDPFWRRFADLGVTPTFHSTGMGWGSRTSPTSYVANHLGLVRRRRRSAVPFAAAGRRDAAVFPNCGSRSSKVASRGPRRCAAIWSAIWKTSR